MMATMVHKDSETLTTNQLDQREPKKRGVLAEQLISFSLKDDPSKMVQVNALVSEEERNRLLKFLHHNVDIFAWLTSDMPRILLKVITHKLNIDPKFKLV